MNTRKQAGTKPGRIMPAEPGDSVILPVSTETRAVYKQKRRPKGDLTALDRKLMCPSCGSVDKILFGFGSQNTDRRYKCKICGRAYLKNQAQDVGEKVEVEGEGLLRAMRHVTRNGPWHDNEPIEIETRAWMAKDKKGFLLEMHKLEREQVADRSLGGMVGADVNAAKVRETIDRLLEEFHQVPIAN